MTVTAVARSPDLPALQSGDVLVFTKRPQPLPTAVTTLRQGKPVTRMTPVGPREAYSLAVSYSVEACRTHARVRAAEYGLRTGSFVEKKGKFYVRVL